MNERQSFDGHWADLANHILPRRIRLSTFDVNNGGKAYRNIVNSTGTRSSRTLATGMMANITNPAKKWFRLNIKGNMEELPEDAKVWLYNRTRELNKVFSKSNVYDALQVLYLDLGVFGTGCILVEDDGEDIVRYTSLPVGSYWAGNDAKDRPRIFVREMRMTVRQIVEEFCKKMPDNSYDISILSYSTQELWNNGSHEEWIDVCHHIYPNDRFRDGSRIAMFKRYRSVYYEKGGGNGKGGSSNYEYDDINNFLRDSGYDEFPLLIGRWAKRAEDVYGTDCPGMLALGDIRALQLMERRKAELVALITRPPMTAVAEVVNNGTSVLPGKITYVSGQNVRDKYAPSVEIRHGTNDIREDIREHELRIKESFYEDLFLMLSQSDRREITAREVDEWHEEKLTALGAVFDRVNKDVLEPLIFLTFNKMKRKGHVPEPPQSIKNMDIQIEYESVMSQAQKLIGLSSIERAAGFYGEISALNPDALDTFDVDELIRVYGDTVSLPPGIIRGAEELESIREQKRAMQQRQEEAMTMVEEAKAAKDLSQAETGGNNALSQMLNGMASNSAVGPDTRGLL